MSDFETAFLKAQAKIKPIPKRGYNPHFKSKYVLLDDLVEGVREPLHSEGLSFRHTSRYEGDKYFVGCEIIHAKSGAPCKAFEMPIPLAEPQKMGSGITYAKRYSLAALLGVASDDDDDGNGASEEKNLAPPPRPVSRPSATRPQGPGKDYTITPNQVKLIYALANKSGWTLNHVADFTSLKFGKPDFKLVTKSELDQLIKAFEQSPVDAVDSEVRREDVPPPQDEDIPF